MTSPRTPFLLLVCLGAALGAAESAFAQIPVARADVDRNCTVTTADANIVKAQLGKRTGQAGFNPNADVDQNGVVNNVDATFVARNIGKNVCAPPPPPPAAPTIVASIAPPANAFGWHNAAATVSFTCTNAVSCPAPVTVSTEGAAQVVARTIANSAGATASASVTLNIDLTPPVVTAIAPAVVAPGAAVAIPVTVVDLSGTGKTTLLLRRAAVDVKTAAPFSLAWTVTGFEPGAVETFEIVAEDRAGNAAAVRRPFTVERPDATLPTVSLGAPATAGPGATVPLTVRASDLVGTIARVVVTRNDGGTPTVIEDRTAGPFAFQAIGQVPAGAAGGSVVTFVAVATDASGNTATTSAGVQVVTSVTTQTLDITVDPPVSPTFQNDGVITGRIGRGTAVVPPPATPLVAAMTPTSAGQGQTVDVTITGVNTTFGPLTQATFGTGVTVQSLTPSTPTTLVARVVVAANAPLGPRLVAVSTGREEAILPNGFAIVSGAGSVSGRVVSPASQPIANAQICQPATTTCSASAADGSFAASGVPVDLKRLVVSAAGYDALSVAVALTPNGTSVIGDVILSPTNQPPPPPLPNSPPVSPAMATVLGRGATELLPSGTPDQMRAVVRDAILAVGGREIGVLDANGQQLNPKMIGAGFASLTDAAIDDIASEMVFGDTMSLSKLLYILSGSITLPPGVARPTLAQLLTALQTRVDLAWQNPSAPESPLVMLLFNKGRVVSATPPRVSFDTELNALQVNVMTVSYMAFVTRYLPEGAAPPYANLTPSGIEGPGFWSRARGLVAALVPRLPAPPSLAVSGLGRRWTGANGLAPLGRPQTPAFQGGGVFGQVGDQPGSTYWADVYKQVMPATSWDAAKKFGSLCDKYVVENITVQGAKQYPGGSVGAALAAEDPNAKFLPAPECKTVIELLEVLATSGSKGYETAVKSMKGYFAGVGATRDMGKAVETWYSNADHQAAWNAAKAEARNTQLTLGLAKIGQGLVEGALSKVQGAIIDKVLSIEANMVIASVRPRQPFIRKVEQLMDPTVTPAAPSHIVKVWFDRSPNDKVEYDDPAIQWRYRLYRGKRNSFSPVAMKVFKKGDELSFSDWVPGDDTYSYVVIGVRQIGTAIFDPPPPSELVGFLGGFIDTTIKVGAEGAKRAVFGVGVITTITTPMTQILKGVRYQVSDASKPETIYVSTTPRAAKPPASLAVWGTTGTAFVNIPALDSIFSVTRGNVSLYAKPNFKAPGSVGLGITSNGTLLTDNAASDAQFGGRVFSFEPRTGARNLAGSVNYFSQLLMFANPVSVQSMVVASGQFGPVGSPSEESLFIADAQSQRITRMYVPTSLPPGVPTTRNISQPWITSPLFNFGPDTALAMSPDLRLAVTQGDNVLLTSPSGTFSAPSSVLPLFGPGTGTPSPYQRLSGVTFDSYANMYVSDSSLGTLTMIPGGLGLSYDMSGLSAVERKKLVVEKGLLRPIDVKLNAGRDGLVYYDAERILAETRFGMSGQVVSDTGAPLAGAIVHEPRSRRIAVTDTDGVFVMPNLVQAGASPVLDFTVQYLGETRSFSRVLDIYRHNIADITFGPPPPIPPDPTVPPTLPVAPAPQKTTTVTSATVSASFELDPTAPPIIATSCPRGVILAPGFDTATTSSSTQVIGLISNRWALGPASVPAAFLVVNGVPFPVTLTGLEFTTTAALSPGNNTLAVALPAGLLKPLGCAPATAADADPYVVSNEHRLFHDPSQAVVDSFRQSAGWDLATRAIVRTGGVPLAGVDFWVPGTDLQATTDGDGVMQINIPKSQMAGAAASADQMAAGVFNDVGRTVAFIRADQTAQSIAALNNLIATAVAAAKAPPAASSVAQTLVDNLVLVQAAAMKLLADVQALQVPNPADVAALESLGLQFASTTSNGEIVITARDYPGLTLTVKVQ